MISLLSYLLICFIFFVIQEIVDTIWDKEIILIQNLLHIWNILVHLKIIFVSTECDTFVGHYPTLSVLLFGVPVFIITQWLKCSVAKVFLVFPDMEVSKCFFFIVNLKVSMTTTIVIEM